MRTSLVKSTYLEQYKKLQRITIWMHFKKLKEISFNDETFGYSASMASVYSSMIEGNRIDFDTYLKYAASGMNTASKLFAEIRDLIEAYQYARDTKLNMANLLRAHGILSRVIIETRQYRGRLRDKEVGVYGAGVKIYGGTAAAILKTETEKLFRDIDILISREMTVQETFYFASMIHLVFVKIHPFADGNGRSARLLEKWFLAEKLGNRAWLIPSEKLYQTRIKSYYKNLRIGSDYTNINYGLAMPFLLMLPMALTMKK